MTTSVNGNQILVQGSGTPPSSGLPSQNDVVLETSTDSGGVTQVTGFRDPATLGGQLQTLNPPVLLANLSSAIAGAEASSVLGSLRGKTLTIPANNTNDPTTANLVYLTSSGPNPVVTGYMFQGQVVTDLPADYKNLTVAAFAEKVSMAFSGTMHSLQGRSYAVSSNSVYADATVPTEGSIFYGEASGSALSSSSGNKVVYGYQTPSGAQSVYEPPIPLSEFLRRMNQEGSPLRGLSLTLVETEPHTIVARAATDVLREPGTGVHANPYLQPSIGALLAVLMMKVAEIDKDTAMKEDRAIENTMAASITQVAMSQASIQHLNDVQRLQAIAMITSSAISIAGSVASLAMIGVAYGRYNRSIAAVQASQPQVVNTPTTTPVAQPQPVGFGGGLPGTQPPPQPTSTAPSAAAVASGQVTAQIAAHNAQQAGVQAGVAAAAAAPPISLTGSAAPLPSGMIAAATTAAPTNMQGVAGLQAQQAQQQTQQAQQQQQQAQQAQFQQQQTQQAVPQASTPTGPTQDELRRRFKGAFNRLEYDQKAAEAVQNIATNVGKIIEEGTKAATMNQKTAAEQAKAYLDTYKDLNETFKGQLVSDRAQVETEFKSALDVAKQMMDNEVNILRQTFGLPG